MSALRSLRYEALGKFGEHSRSQGFSWLCLKQLLRIFCAQWLRSGKQFILYTQTLMLIFSTLFSLILYGTNMENLFLQLGDP